jgi:hypothetical protein
VAYLAVAARAALVVVFAVSAGSKLRDRRHFGAFADSLRPIVAARLAGATAAAVAVTEAACAALLLIPAGAGYGFLLAAVVLAAFTAAAGWVTITRRQVPCRCFGIQARPIGPRHVARNSVLFLLALCGLGAGPVPAAGAVVAATAGVIGALLLIRLDDLADLWHPA